MFLDEEGCRHRSLDICVKGNGAGPRLQVEWLALASPEKVAAAHVIGCRSSMWFQFALEPRTKMLRWSSLPTREQMVATQSMNLLPSDSVVGEEAWRGEVCGP